MYVFMYVCMYIHMHFLAMQININLNLENAICQIGLQSNKVLLSMHKIDTPSNHIASDRFAVQ